MLQFTYLQNGGITIATDTSDTLLTELFKQFEQGLNIVPRSYIPRSAFSPITRVTVSSDAPKLINGAFEVYEISPITRKVVARDAESFFAGLVKEAEKGFRYDAGSAKMTYGSFSAVLKKGVESTEVPVIDGVPDFDISVALALTTKDELIVYCEQYGIEVDKRKSLPKIQNWLRAKTSEGK